MKVTSTPGFKPTIPNQPDGAAAVPTFIPPQIDAILEDNDRIVVERWTDKLYIHINGITVLRVGGIRPSQIESQGEFIP